MGSIFQYHDKLDILARFIGIGIFVIENINHIKNFESEVTFMVFPALSFLPRSVCSIVHMFTITLGLGGSVAFLFSGYEKYRGLTGVSLKALLIFMLIITWNWWLRRNGEFPWNVVDPSDRRNRTIHCLKNATIFGLLLMIHRSATRNQSTKRL